MENEMLYREQFGFQKQESTENPVIDVVHEITNVFRVILHWKLIIEFSKAFETVCKPWRPITKKFI